MANLKNSQIAFLTSWNIIMNFGHFHGQVNFQAGQILLGSGVLSLEWLVANCQTYILFNAILIFKPDVFEGIVDNDLRWINRGCVFVNAILFKMMDSAFPQGPKALEYMTSKDKKS